MKPTNLSELKAEYRKLAKKMHPDKGGTESQMKNLNNYYNKHKSNFEKYGTFKVK